MSIPLPAIIQFPNSSAKVIPTKSNIQFLVAQDLENTPKAENAAESEKFNSQFENQISHSKSVLDLGPHLVPQYIAKIQSGNNVYFGSCPNSSLYDQNDRSLITQQFQNPNPNLVFQPLDSISNYGRDLLYSNNPPVETDNGFVHEEGADLVDTSLALTHPNPQSQHSMVSKAWVPNTFSQSQHCIAILDKKTSKLDLIPMPFKYSFSQYNAQLLESSMNQAEKSSNELAQQAKVFEKLSDEEKQRKTYENQMEDRAHRIQTLSNKRAKKSFQVTKNFNDSIKSGASASLSSENTNESKLYHEMTDRLKDTIEQTKVSDTVLIRLENGAVQFPTLPPVYLDQKKAHNCYPLDQFLTPDLIRGLSQAHTILKIIYSGNKPTGMTFFWPQYVFWIQQFCQLEYEAPDVSAPLAEQGFSDQDDDDVGIHRDSSSTNRVSTLQHQIFSSSSDDDDDSDSQNENQSSVSGSSSQSSSSSSDDQEDFDSSSDSSNDESTVDLTAESVSETKSLDNTESSKPTPLILTPNILQNCYNKQGIIHYQLRIYFLALIVFYFRFHHLLKRWNHINFAKKGQSIKETENSIYSDDVVGLGYFLDAPPPVAQFFVDTFCHKNGFGKPIVSKQKSDFLINSNLILCLCVSPFYWSIPVKILKSDFQNSGLSKYTYALGCRKVPKTKKTAQSEISSARTKRNRDGSPIEELSDESDDESDDESSQDDNPIPNDLVIPIGNAFTSLRGPLQDKLVKPGRQYSYSQLRRMK